MRHLLQGVLNLIAVIFMFAVFLLTIRIGAAINYYSFPSEAKFDYFISGPVTTEVLQTLEKSGEYVGYLQYLPIIESKNERNYSASLIVFDKLSDLHTTWYNQVLAKDDYIGSNIVGIDYFTAKRYGVWLGDNINLSFPKENISLQFKVNTIYRTNYYTDNKIIILRESGLISSKDFSKLNKLGEIYSSIFYSGPHPQINQNKFILLSKDEVKKGSFTALVGTLKNNLGVLSIPLVLSLGIEYISRNKGYRLRVLFALAGGVAAALYFDLPLNVSSTFLAILATMLPWIIMITTKKYIK